MATRMPEPGRPTPRMIRLYHRYVERFGEPPELWVFDPADIPAPPSTLRYKNVAAWPADHECDVTSFCTLGMSDRLMPGTEERAELHMGVRARLNKQQRQAVAGFLANVTEYPFENSLALDWWHVLNSPGCIPCFPNCRHLIFTAPLGQGGFEAVADESGPVKLLLLVPITPLERHLAVDHGKDALLEHWDEQGVDVFTDRTDPEGQA